MKLSDAEQAVIKTLDEVSRDLSKGEYYELICGLCENLEERGDAALQEMREEESK